MVRSALPLSAFMFAACAGGDKDLGTPPDETGVETLPGSDTADTGVLGEEVPEPIPDVIVDCTGGADFTTIGDAVTASLSGTKIGLNPCTYHEDLDFRGKSLDIFGIDGSAVTFLVGTGTGAVVKANHGESVGTRLAGVTVSGGATLGYYGSGLSADLAVLQLEDVIFTGNDVGYSVVYTTGAFLELLDVTFTGNHVTPTGGILVMDDSAAVAQRLTVSCDEGDDAAFAIYQHNALLLLESTIACGNDYGVYSAGCGAHVRRSRVESPGTALYGGDADDTRNERLWLWNSAFLGGDTAVSALFVHVKAENNVFWGGAVGLDLQFVHTESYVWGSVFNGDSCGVRTDAGVTYDLGWNADLGADCGAATHDSQTGEPGFVDAPNDFTLKTTSPLIDAGNPEEDSEDVDGTRNDIGVYGGPSGSW